MRRFEGVWSLATCVVKEKSEFIMILSSGCLGQEGYEVCGDFDGQNAFICGGRWYNIAKGFWSKDGFLEGHVGCIVSSWCAPRGIGRWYARILEGIRGRFKL